MDLQAILAFTEQAFFQALANDLFAARFDGFQIAVIATLQAAFTVAYVHGMRRSIEQCTHELDLIVQRAFGALALLDLPTQACVPDQRQ
ncbi:hypothetical protein D3C86_1989670 [compost metagenome]